MAATITTAATARSAGRGGPGAWPPGGGPGAGRQIRQKGADLVAVPAPEHRVNPLHTLFDAQAALSDGIGHPAGGLVPLQVGHEHRPRRMRAVKGGGPGLATGQHGPGSVRTLTSGPENEGHEGDDQEREDETP